MVLLLLVIIARFYILAILVSLKRHILYDRSLLKNMRNDTISVTRYSTHCRISSRTGEKKRGLLDVTVTKIWNDCNGVEKKKTKLCTGKSPNRRDITDFWGIV